MVNENDPHDNPNSLNINDPPPRLNFRVFNSRHEADIVKLLRIGRSINRISQLFAERFPVFDFDIEVFKHVHRPVRTNYDAVVKIPRRDWLNQVAFSCSLEDCWKRVAYPPDRAIAEQ